MVGQRHGHHQAEALQLAEARNHVEVPACVKQGGAGRVKKVGFWWGRLGKL
jgi:hypothetical protein